MNAFNVQKMYFTNQPKIIFIGVSGVIVDVFASQHNQNNINKQQQTNEKKNQYRQLR